MPPPLHAGAAADFFYTGPGPYLPIPEGLRVRCQRKRVDLTDQLHFSLDDKRTVLHDDACRFERFGDLYFFYLSISDVAHTTTFHLHKLPESYRFVPANSKREYSLDGGVKRALTLEIVTDLEEVLDACFFPSDIKVLSLSHASHAHGSHPVPALDDKLYELSAENISGHNTPIPARLEQEFLYLTKARTTQRGVQNLMIEWSHLLGKLLQQEGAPAVYKDPNAACFDYEPVANPYLASTSPLRQAMACFNLGQADRVVNMRNNRFSKDSVRRYVERVKLEKGIAA
jgi:hypothetical protein